MFISFALYFNASSFDMGYLLTSISSSLSLKFISNSHLDIFIFLLPSIFISILPNAKDILIIISIKSIIIDIIFIIFPFLFIGLVVFCPP